MTRFRPCIDVHQGKVKQLVGQSLGDPKGGVICRFESSESSDKFARLFREDGAVGGHVIMLGGPAHGNDAAALKALAEWPEAFRVGGGIRADTASSWLAAGAAKIIVTSAAFDEGPGCPVPVLSRNNLRKLSEAVGSERLVVDLSCISISEVPPGSKYAQRCKNTSSCCQPECSYNEADSAWRICLNGWKTISQSWLNTATLELVGEFCQEILVHAVAVEGTAGGIDESLVEFLSNRSHKLLPAAVYAGGVASIKCLERVEQLSSGTVDVCVGASLDIYGGNGVKYRDCIAWNSARPPL